MGDDAADYFRRKGPFQGKVAGTVSVDGKKVYRIDVDKGSGEAHINWCKNKEKGSIPFKGCERQVKSVVDNAVH